MKNNLTGFEIWNFTSNLAIVSFILMLCVSCQKDEAKPIIETVSDYFPISSGNHWIYTKEGVKSDGQISSSSVEKWEVNSNFFIGLYEVTLSGEEYLGYKALYKKDILEIDDIIGTFISVKYLNLPTDSLVLVAFDSINFLRERWIRGGLVKLESSYGMLECICSKTTYHFPHNQQDEYLYFCKDIGIVLMEKNYIDEDSTGNRYIGFSWRRTLTDYQLKHL